MLEKAEALCSSEIAGCNLIPIDAFVRKSGRRKPSRKAGRQYREHKGDPREAREGVQEAAASAAANKAGDIRLEAYQPLY